MIELAEGIRQGSNAIFTVLSWLLCPTVITVIIVCWRSSRGGKS